MNAELLAKARIAEDIVNGKEFSPDSAVSLSLTDFREIYVETIYQLGNVNPYVVLIFLGDQVLVTFPQYSAQRFQVLPGKSCFLTAKDFDFIIHKQIYGSQERPVSFLRFVASEVKNYWKWLFVAFLLSLIFLHFSGSKDTYSVLAGVLIQSSTVFVSVFLIFTVTQSVLVQQDVALFQRGLLHRYRRDDRNVAILGILVIGGVILNTMFVNLPYNFGIIIQGYELNLFNFWGAISTSLVITMLLDAFISVVSYYLERSQDIVDRDLSQKIFEAEREQIKKLTGK